MRLSNITGNLLQKALYQYRSHVHIKHYRYSFTKGIVPVQKACAYQALPVIFYKRLCTTDIFSKWSVLFLDWRFPEKSILFKNYWNFKVVYEQNYWFNTNMINTQNKAEALNFLLITLSCKKKWNIQIFLLPYSIPPLQGRTVSDP